MSETFWLRYLAAILTVGAVLWVLARLGRSLRARSRGSARRLRAVESLPLAQNVSAHLVEADGREFIVIAGGSSIALRRKRVLMQQSGNDVDD
jgi:flagellar biogenesis protein FliO